jgi:hypothetical protein
MRRPQLLFFLLLLLTGCVASRQAYNPNRKYSPAALHEDYSLFRNILEDAHPSLYWYTPKDSIDYYFARGESMINDSLTETKFRNVLTYVVSKFRCGHTTVRLSKGAQKYSNPTTPSFPLYVKMWPDTTVVTANLNRKDSNLIKGVILESIDGMPMQTIIDSMFSHLSADGYNATHKYQTLSNGGNFRTMYAALYGLKPEMKVDFIDTSGKYRSSVLKLYNPSTDTIRTRIVPHHFTRKERRNQELMGARNLTIDTSLHTAIMEVNTFGKRDKLRGFFRKSFRKIRKEHLHNLIVDMRANGGGSVTLSNLLVKYISNSSFKMADSLYAVKVGSPYGHYQQNRFLNWLFLAFFTHRGKDAHYHFSYFENRYFNPKRSNHFNGTTYILIGGNTFSAATLFTKALIGQPTVSVIGEETGGGAYGNTAWLIPDVTLPNTKVIFRLPLFRLVIDKTAQKGRGVRPQVPVLPTVSDIRKNKDYKMEKAKELIRQHQLK